MQGVLPPEARRIVLAITVLAGFLTPFDGSAVTIALPSIGSQFAMDAVTLSWVGTAYLLAAAVFLVPFGRIADIFGRRKVFSLGISIFTLASFLMLSAPNAIFFVAMRALQGTGGAMIFGTGIAILTAAYPVGERGKVLGIYTTAVYLGLSTGPIIGGFITAFSGWHGIFLVNIPLGLATLVLVQRKVHAEWADAEGERFDLLGSFLYGGSLVVLILGMTGLPDQSAFLWIGAGVAGLFAFVIRETHVSSPVFRMSLILENRVFAFSNLTALINYSATYAITFLTSLYLQFIKGYSPIHAGILIIPMPLVQAVFSSFAGRLSDRIEPGVVASAGMGIISCGLLTLVFLDPGTPYWHLLASLVLVGFGMAFFTSPNTNAIMSSVEKRYYSVASGTLATMRVLGQMTSMALVAMIFSIVIGEVAITPEVYPRFMESLRIIFMVFVVLCLTGVFTSLVRGRVRGDGALKG